MVSDIANSFLSTGPKGNEAGLRDPLSPTSIRLAHKNEGRAGDDGGAGADEGDIGILDLARAGAAGGLQGALDDVPQAVDAAGAEAAAEGVEGKIAVEFDAA